jgi:hypothetical protein
MRNRVLQLGALTIAALGATAFSIGGWAVITVDDLPQTLAVGQPIGIGFMVRQHGVTPLDRLTPTIFASDDKHEASEVRVSAIPSGPAGHYVATLVVPQSRNALSHPRGHTNDTHSKRQRARWRWTPSLRRERVRYMSRARFGRWK